MYRECQTLYTDVIMIHSRNPEIFSFSFICVQLPTSILTLHMETKSGQRAIPSADLVILTCCCAGFGCVYGFCTKFPEAKKGSSANIYTFFHVRLCIRSGRPGQTGHTWQIGQMWLYIHHPYIWTMEAVLCSLSWVIYSLWLKMQIHIICITGIDWHINHFKALYKF